MPIRRAVLLVSGALICAALVSCSGEKGPSEPPRPVTLPVTDLDVGLSPEDVRVWRSTPEGSDLVPVDTLRALIDVNTGRPFSESMERYGFLPSPASEANPYGLPVGWTVSVPDYSPLKLDYVGVNCSACHSGQIEYEGRAFRIDGAPNLADIEAFAVAAEDSVLEMLESPRETLHFIARLVKLEPPAGANPSATLGGQLSDEARDFLDRLSQALADDKREARDAVARAMGKVFVKLLRGETAESASDLADRLAGRLESTALGEHVREIYEVVRMYRLLLSNRIELGVRALGAIRESPEAGPGRDDPWNLARTLMFGSDALLTAPTSIPALYWARDFDWYHADGNTNSVMQRDIVQVVSLGAYVDAETGQSTVLPRNVWALEDLMRKLDSPAWPEHFPSIDPEKAARGEAVFRRKTQAPGGGRFACNDCHADRSAKLLTLEAVGTDPNRAESFMRPQGGVPFWVALPEAVTKIETFANEKAGITPDEAKEHEVSDPPLWRGTGKYVARRLDGIWSTAPYLHNASVPTLNDLLLPADQRPRRFPVGHRRYDPVKVGYATDVAAADGLVQPIFDFDCSLDGNSNAGHEYGTGLEEADREDLIEYLKTL